MCVRAKSRVRLCLRTVTRKAWNNGLVRDASTAGAHVRTLCCSQTPAPGGTQQSLPEEWLWRDLCWRNVFRRCCRTGAWAHPGLCQCRPLEGASQGCVVPQAWLLGPRLAGSRTMAKGCWTADTVSGKVASSSCQNGPGWGTPACRFRRLQPGLSGDSLR